MIRARLLLIAGAVLLPAPVAIARHEGHGGVQQACAALPAELAAWTGARVKRKAAPSPAKLASAALPVGQAVEAALLPMTKLSFAVQPEKPGGSVSKGGLFRVDIAEAGTYRVALGSGPWIDVIEKGAALPSIAHGHGPECSGIRKMVDYEMQAGPHILQISGNGDAALTLMVVRLR